MDKLYTIQEVAAKLNLSDKTLRRWEDAGKFSSSRTLGNQRRYSLEDLQILDAIKHGTINEQNDLLNIDQAAKLCGVGPSSLLRWEESGKIHPFITSGNTYYIRQKLMEKMAELKKLPVEPKLEPSLSFTETINKPKLSPLFPKTEYAPLQQQASPFNLQNSIVNALITIILILSYHLLFNSGPSKPLSPKSGSVQGVSTFSDPTIDLLKTLLDPSGAFTTTTLTSRNGLISPSLSLSPSSAPISPAPGTIYYDASSESLKIFKGSSWSELSPSNNYRVSDSLLITGSAVLSKGKNQITLNHEKITPTTPITLTFTADYAPAKKYWVGSNQGSFTLYTDFPVAADVTFNYSFIAPNL